jgi:DNA damage-binding protein 1
MAYLYLATTQRATSVTASTVCSFTDANDRNLILARGSHVEVFTITSEGLSLVRSIAFYGRITKLEAYRPSNQNKDVLFILTAKLNFCVLVWDSTTNQPVFRATGSLNDRTGKPVENGHLSFIDPENRMVGVMVLEGQVKVS